jgi:hypothetical protein
MPMTGNADETVLVGKPETVVLRRSPDTPYAVLYGRGVTIGTGINVLLPLLLIATMRRRRPNRSRAPRRRGTCASRCPAP